MDFSWLTAGNDLVTVIATGIATIAGAVFAHRKGWFSATVAGVEAGVKFVEQKGAQAVHDVEAVAVGLGQLSPAVATAERALKSQVDHVTANFRQSELCKLASIGLHAFASTLDSLSADQRKALEFFIASRVPDVTPQEVADAISLAQKEADAAATSPLFQSANAFTEAQKKQTAQDANAGVAQ